MKRKVKIKFLNKNKVQLTTFSENKIIELTEDEYNIDLVSLTKDNGFNFFMKLISDSGDFYDDWIIRIFVKSTKGNNFECVYENFWLNVRSNTISVSANVWED